MMRGGSTAYLPVLEPQRIATGSQVRRAVRVAKQLSGNPEVQPFDIIYIETDFEKYVTARTTKNTISFGSGMTGTWEGIKL